MRLLGVGVLAAVVAFVVVWGVSQADQLGGADARGPVVQGRSDLVESDAAAHALHATEVRTDPRVVEQPGSVGSAGSSKPGGRLVPELTSQFANTYLQTDGSLVSRVSATPVNYRDGQGDWHAIDDRLVADGSGAHVAGDRYALQLPSSLGGGAVQMSGQGRGVSFQLEGAAGAAGVTSGNTDTFADVLPSTSASYSATPRGVSETLTLADAQAPKEFAYQLALSGDLAPTQTADGGIVFRDSDGKTRFSVAPAYMYDDAAAQAPSVSGGASAPVPMSVARDGAGWRLTLTPDRAWVLAHLADGPVRVDPEWFYDDDYDDCRIDGGSPTTSFCGASNLEVGWNGSNDHRALVVYDFEGLIPKDAVISQATMGMYLYSHSTSTAKQVGVYRVTQPWTSSATWNKYDATHSWTSAGGDSSSTFGAVTSGVGTATGWVNWFPTQIVQQWVDGSQPNYGVLVKDAQSSVSNDLNFRSGYYSDTSVRPYMDVLWRLRAGDRPSYTIVRQHLNARTDLGVNVANGNLLLHSNDLRIAGKAGYGLSYDRYYNSLLQSIGYSGSQGAGATTGYGLDRWIRGLDDGSVELFMGDGSAFAFIANSDGTFQTPPGLNATLTEDGSGAFTLTFNQTGEEWHFDWGIDTEVTSITDRYGNTIGSSHRSDGSLSGLTDTQGRSVSVGTDSGGHRFVTSLGDSTSRSWSYGFDTGFTHLTSYTDPASHTTSYGYDGSGRMTSITLPSGNVTKITYDGTSGRVASIIRTTDSGHTTGPTTSFTYGSGTPCATGETKTVVSDPDATGSNGHTVTYCTDSRDRLTKQVDSDGNTRTFTYTSNDDLASETPASGGSTGYGYDALNNLISIQEGGSSGATKTVAYADGSDPYLPTKQTDPNGNYQHATFAGPSNSSGPEGALLQVDSDTQSGESAQAPQVATTFTYNSSGAMTSSTDGSGNTTSYGYDSSGNLTSVTPPSGSGMGAVSITPDALGREHVITEHVTSTLTRSATITYDSLDRVTEVDYANSSGTGAFSVTTSYDNDGNPVSRTDPQGTTSYTFDPLNRLTEDNPPGSADNQYGYDAASNLTSFIDGSGTTTYHYNGVNEFDSMTEPGDSSATTFTYDANGQPLRTTYTTGVTLSHTYDSATGQLTDIANRKAPAGSGTLLSEFTFNYGVGSVTGDLVRSTTASDGANSNTTTYSYDALSQLVQAVTTGSSVNQYFAYTLDAAGNRTRQVVNLSGNTSTGATTTSYAYNAGNQMCWQYTGTSTNSCGSPPSGATTYTFNQADDETGASSGLAFAYNNAGQTTSVTPAGGSAKALSYLGGGQDQLIQRGSASLQNSLLGVSSQTDSGSTTYYGRTPDGTLVDERTPSARYWYVFGGDTVGSVQGLVDSSGNWHATRSYTPYGETDSSTGSDSNPFWYAGGLETTPGIYHFGQRYYAPDQQRWSQVDPLSRLGDLAASSGYEYADSNPLSLADPSGENPNLGAFIACLAGHLAAAGAGHCLEDCANCASAIVHGHPAGIYSCIKCGICLWRTGTKHIFRMCWAAHMEGPHGTPQCPIA
jgi:RHS repeat-associated protein